MNELVKKITRSYTKKTNLGNYESFDTMASYSEEVPAETTKEDMQRISAMLYDMAKSDVEQAILDYKREQFKDAPKYKVSPKDSFESQDQSIYE